MPVIGKVSTARTVCAPG